MSDPTFEHGTIESKVPLDQKLMKKASKMKKRDLLHISNFNFFNFRVIVKELMDLLNQDRSPLCNTRPQQILDPSIAKNS